MTGRLDKSYNLLLTIQEKIKWVDNMNEVDRHHKKEIEDKVKEMWKIIKVSDILISLQYDAPPSPLLESNMDVFI